MAYDALIDKEELARRMDVSIACLDQWIRARRIPVYVLGSRCVRFDFSEVREALANFQRPALRRFPRATYRPRKRLRAEKIARQLRLPSIEEDPRQLLFSFVDRRPAVPTDGEEQGASLRDTNVQRQVDPARGKDSRRRS